MMETKNVGGLILALVMLSSGATLYLQDTGSKSSCVSGWTYKGDGIWSCGARVNYCYDVYNSSNTANYWCKIGKPLVPEVLNNNTELITGACEENGYSCDQIKCTPIKIKRC